jgi:peptide/nickel transport system ATP-binding protein
MSLLSVQDLRVHLGGREAVAGVSFDLAAGDVLGLVGESGSGKSLTALSLLGLLPEAAGVSGRLLLEGVDLARLTEAELCAVRGRDIAMVFQEPMTALNPLHRIGDQVAEGLVRHQGLSRRAAGAAAAEWLARVGLDPARISPKRFPHELSGGQRQRVAIAMALACGPKLLIADEPTTALDVTTQAQCLDLMTRLTEETGAALLFISHDLAVVGQMARRIAVMRQGQIVEQGTAREVLGAPRHDYTQALIQASRLGPAPALTEPSNAAPLLRAVSVTRSYPPPRSGWFARPAAVPAVSAVTLQIAARERVGLVGESGCGKSTLLRTLLALEEPQDGEVWLAGERFSRRSEADRRALRRKVQLVFQDPAGSFNPRHPVGRLIAEPLDLLDPPPTPQQKRDRVAALLEQVGLKAADANRYPHQFSGGQRQRIAIARALSPEPALLALDEAVSALDVSIRAQILELLEELGDRLGVALLFVSHDLAVVRRLTRRVLVMQAGQIVEEGVTEEVFSNPKHAYTRSLLAATPTLDQALARLADRETQG